jgi:5'-3' exonuclease
MASLEWLKNSSTDIHIGMHDPTKARILDFSQVAIATAFSGCSQINGSCSREYLIHLILMSVKNMFFGWDGEKIIAVDGKRNWRYNIFPMYKHKRKETRRDTTFKWEDLYFAMGEVVDILKSSSSIKVICDNSAEADDVIFAAAKKYRTLEIYSSDKDFFQLHRPGVIQISPKTKEQIGPKNPRDELAELILRGDASDGVPNVLSPDDIFVRGDRQSPVTKKNAQVWHENVDDNGLPNQKIIDLFVNGEIFESSKKKGLTAKELKQNMRRNMKLIGLSFVPDDVHKRINEELECRVTPSKERFVEFCDKHQLIAFKESIDFMVAK